MKKELLSPAGDFETLKQAIHNGCDAVYLGGKRFGARKFASNFDEQEMVKAIKYCHLYGVKIYVTVNTIIFDEEVDDCLEYITFLHKNGVDAVIMQDIGMIVLVRKVLPNLDIHVSTQAHTHNVNQIKLLENLGVTRVVLAREMSLDEIKKINTSLEIEAFVHGALCVCYSGQCLFSSFLLNRSGNRGECAGICRLPFTLLEDGKKVDTEGKCLLSPKELNTTNHIKELLDSNITSFKIEGRMKSPTTIGFITRLYRMLIDHYNNGEVVSLTEQEQEKLMVLFNRGFTEGYLFNKSGRDLMNITSPNHIGVVIGKVISTTPKRIKIKLNKPLHQNDGIRFEQEQLGMIVNYIYDSHDKLIASANSGDIIEIDNKIGISSVNGNVLKTVDSLLLDELEKYSEKKIDIKLNVSASVDGIFILNISDGVNNISVEDKIIEKATGSGTTKERILEQLLKLGDTPFKVVHYDLDIDNGIFVPISKINELRRLAVAELVDLRENSKKEVIVNDVFSLDNQSSSSKIMINALVRNEEQLLTCMDMNLDTIYVTDYNLYKKYHNLDNIYYRVNRVMFDFPDYDKERLLVGEMGSIYKYINNNTVRGDYYLNVANSYHVSYLRNLGVDNITLSVENSIDTISHIVDKIGNKNIEVIVYGRLEAMIMKYCPLKMIINNDKKPCSVCRNGKKYELVDRNGAHYPLLQDRELTHILYYQNYDRLDNVQKLASIGVLNYRFEFFNENSNEIKEIIKNTKTILSII